MQEARIKSHILQLQGKVELPQEIGGGHNYHVSVSGSITSIAESDNEDGTWNRTYKFRPVKLELLDALGKTIVAKDARKQSQLTRGLVRKLWLERQSPLEEEEFYNRVMGFVRANLEELLERAGL